MENKKLTLEHLASYLPYDLELLNGYQFPDPDSFNNTILLKWSSIDCVLNNGMGCKPYLRPLSDMPDDMFQSFGFADEENFQYCVYSGIIPHSDWIRLVKEKYDVFGLIDAGLAIDINTIDHEG